jgi:hypothetical protein
MIAARARLCLTIVALSSLALAGCRDDLTEVALVIESDLRVPGEVDGMDVASIDGGFAPPVNQFFGGGVPLTPFPLSVGFASGGTTTSFSITVRMFVGTFQTPTPQLVMSRTVTDIRFVPGQTMMLVLPMNRACACQGTSCPSDPACDNITRPTVVPFDPAVAPPSSTINPNTGAVRPPQGKAAM